MACMCRCTARTGAWPCVQTPCEPGRRGAAQVRTAPGRQRGVGDLQYYNADVHGALFALPNYYRKLVLASAERLPLINIHFQSWNAEIALSISAKCYSICIQGRRLQPQQRLLEGAVGGLVAQPNAEQGIERIAGRQTAAGALGR